MFSPSATASDGRAFIFFAKSTFFHAGQREKKAREIVTPV
jgi:hypothetical protein